MLLHAYIYTGGCTLNSRLLSGHHLFSPSAMVRWVCNSRDPVLCARILLLYKVFRKVRTQLSYKLQVQGSNTREFFFIRVFKEVLSSEFVQLEQKHNNCNQQKTRLEASKLPAVFTPALMVLIINCLCAYLLKCT